MQDQGVVDLTGVGDRIRARIAATGADVVVLPIRVDARNGKNVYSQQDVLIVKRLKAEGIRAAYLDDSEDRVFESLNSAELVIAGTLVLGIATNFAYDALKAIVKRMWRRSNSNDQISLRITDATDTTPSEWTLTGSPADVLDTLEKLKDRDLLLRDLPPDDLMGGRPSEPVEPSEHVMVAIEERLAAADALRAEAQALLEQPAGQLEEAEKKTVAALAEYRSALDWAEDTDRREEIHEKLDAAGRWRRERFLCSIEYSDGKYWETCPVSLGHYRVGFSVGGVAYRACSICGFDFTECEHDPAGTYLVAGGTAVANHCRVCGVTDCAIHETHLMYDATPISIITEMRVDEVSLVSRPAFKDARIHRRELLARDLPLVDDQIVPAGALLTCNKCLNDCGGLIEEPDRR